MAMLNPRENMVVIDGQIKTVEIHSIQLNERGDKYNILFKSAKYKCYSYSRNNVAWLTNPIVFNPQDCHAFYRGKLLHQVTYIAAFKNYFHTYWFFAFADGKTFSFYDDDITLKKSYLADGQSKSVFEYLRSVAAIAGYYNKKEDTKPSFFRTGYPHPYHLQQQPFQQPRPTSTLYILYTDFRFYDHSRSFFQQECISLNHLGSWLIGQNSMMRFV